MIIDAIEQHDYFSRSFTDAANLQALYAHSIPKSEQFLQGFHGLTIICEVFCNSHCTSEADFLSSTLDQFLHTGLNKAAPQNNLEKTNHSSFIFVMAKEKPYSSTVRNV